LVLPPSFASVGGFKSLVELSMVGCTNATFPELTAAAMPCLSRLVLTGWDQLTSLPHSLQHLHNLRRLEVDICRNLHRLDDTLDLRSLTQLEELNLFYCTALTSLPLSLVSLPTFKVLKLRHCKAPMPTQLSELKSNGQLTVIS
jgi:hypothetical protein